MANDLKLAHQKILNGAIKQGECLVYRGIRDEYNHIRLNGKNPVMHRIVWEFHNGPIPAGLFVCHKCDVKGCVNIDHLFLGTPFENMLDKVRKGRQSHGNAGAGLMPKGEKHPMSKLTDDQVRAIRKDPRIGRIIATEYGVGQTQVSRIKIRKAWGHVAD